MDEFQNIYTLFRFPSPLIAQVELFLFNSLSDLFLELVFIPCIDGC